MSMNGIYMASADFGDAVAAQIGKCGTAYNTSRRRLVDVFIVDTHPCVPVENAMMYRQENIFTDKTDDELWLDADIQSLLKKHNAKRVTWDNAMSNIKGAKLPPARLHDLKRIVGTTVSF